MYQEHIKKQYIKSISIQEIMRKNDGIKNLRKNNCAHSNKCIDVGIKLNDLFSAVYLNKFTVFVETPCSRNFSKCFFVPTVCISI